MKKNYPFYCLLFLILTVIFFAGCNDSAEGNSSCQHIVIIDKEIAATCTSTGLTEGKHCSVCNKVLVNQQIIPKTEHLYKTTITTQPTCIEWGYTTYICNCGEKYCADYTAPDHDFDYWYTLKEPTCITEGLKRKDCKNCDNYTTKAIPKISHSYTKEIITQPTCTRQGFTTYECDCGKSYVSNYIGARHTYGAWEIIVESSCSELGEIRRNCKNCDHYETDEIPKQNHTITYHDEKIPTCTEIGWEAYETCDKCDYTTYCELPNQHTFENYKCKICGNYSFCVNEKGVEYIDKNGLTIKLISFSKVEYEEYDAYTINYTVENNVPDYFNQIQQGSFRLFVDDGSIKRQYGMFMSLEYQEKQSHTYTWKIPKNQKVLLLEYNADDESKGDKPVSDALHWII